MHIATCVLNLDTENHTTFIFNDHKMAVAGESDVEEDLLSVAFGCDVEEDSLSVAFVDEDSIFGRALHKENGTCHIADKCQDEELKKASDSTANKKSQTEESSVFGELIKQDTEGDTPLHIAIINKLTKAALFIIRILSTCQLSIANEIGQTPLHLAALVGDTQVIKALIAKKVDLNQRDTKGRTVFHILCQSGQTNCLSMLVPELHVRNPNRVNLQETNLVPALNAIDGEGKSCLHHACIQGDIQLVDCLLSLDVYPNLKDRKTGRTALHFSAECGHLKIVQALIKHKDTNVNFEAYDEITPVALAYHRKKHNIVACLRKNGANYSKRHIEKFGPWRD